MGGWRRAALFIAFASILIGADAQNIFSNTIDDPNPSSANPFTSGQVVAANVTASGIGRGPGISNNDAQNRYNAKGWSIAFDANDHFTFTITPAAGYKIDFTSFSYHGQASGTGPTTAAFRSSVDGYAANIGSATISGTTISLSAAAYQNITSAITFRFYAWGGTNASTGTFSINDFAFNGTVVQLPVVNTSVTSLPAFDTQLGTPSAAQTFTVTGTALTAPLVVTAPAGFEVRENNVGDYAGSVSFSGATVNETVQVRLTAAATGSFSGNVTCAATGATTKNVAVSGTVIDVNTGIQFSTAAVAVAENAGTMTLTLLITNESTSAATDIDVVLTSGDPALVDGFTAQHVTFPAGSSASIEVPLTIADNSVWNGDHTLTFALQNMSGGQGTPTIGTNGTLTLTIQEYLSMALVLNEIDYSMPGEAAEFIELKNTGTSAIDLAGFLLDLVYEDGGPQAYADAIALPSFVLQPGDHYVVCGDPVNVPNCDLTSPVAIDFIAGGLPAAIGLRGPTNVLVDAVSYEGNVSGGYAEGDATGLIDPADQVGVSLARIPDGQDTQQNGTDLRQSCPTPGAANTAEGQSCDDGDPNTILDVIGADCTCAGIPVPTEDCLGVTGGPALPGTPCDDGDEETLNDAWSAECACVGTPVVRDCLGAIDGPAMPGTACDDSNAFTENDTWSTECVCAGDLVPTPPTVVTGSASSVTAGAAVLNGSLSSEGSSAVSSYGFEYSTTNGFALGTGTPVISSDLTEGSFTASVSGLVPNTTYYFIAYATNNEGTGNGAQASFTTAPLTAPVATAATDIGENAFTANWEMVEGATGFRLDVSPLAMFGTTTLATDLFFSEYVEGSSNNKYIEIFNGTGATVDLSNYRLRLYSNGGTSVTNEAALSGMLANGATIVLRNSGAIVYGGATTVNSAVNYNGDDAVALFKVSTGANVDIFGRIGEDPGSAWTAGGLSTVDRTLIRKPTVTGGVTVNPSAGFPTLATEWMGAATDNVSDLGQHDFPSFVPNYVPGFGDLAVEGLSKVVTGLAPSTTYYYRLRATNGTQVSGNSNVIEARTGVLDCEGVLDGPALPGTACDDGNADTGDDIYGEDCVCAGQSLDCLGVPGGTATIGSPCDDGDANTGDDVYGTDCICAGQIIDCLGVVGGTTLPGSPCDDGDADTGDDVYGTDCTCAGQLIDCLGVAGGTALPGTSCDDVNADTGNDVYGTDCICAGQPIDCLGVAGGTTLPGTSCDDGDANTGDDVYGEDCVCAGQPLDCIGVPGGTATIGSPCDDGNADTGNDVYGTDCICAGQPIDCLGVAGGTALPGTSCDDGDANTGNDIYGEDCVCAGQSLDCLGVPGGTATIGSPCDDGDANTGDDVYGTDCICAGQLIDCLGVAGGTALPGSPCDDGDANTGDDVYGEDCSCAGTPVGPCTGNQVVVTIHTDANGGQTTWQIQDAFAFTLASGGPYTGQDNTTVSETACLPTTFGNCYSFFLFDSFGDGLCCANGNGYWELNTPGGATLLRDRFEASTNGSQSPSTTPLSAGYLLGHEFCLPEGPSNILPEGCGVFSNTLQSKVYTRAIPGVASYQFEFSDPDAGFRRRIAVPRNWVKFSEMQTSPLVPGVTYFARARADQGASGFEDDHFGSGCEMGVDPASIGCTSLIDDPVQPTHSCGAIKHFGGSDKIWARPLLGATQYRFRFTNAGEGFVRQIDRPSYVCLLSWVTTPLQPGVTYDVTVNALVSGAWTGFCGSTCQLTIIGNSSGASRMTTVDEQADLRLWPNPVGDGRVNLRIDRMAEAQQRINVELYDVFGKRAMTQAFENTGGSVNTILQLPSTLAKGVYLVNITINGRTSVQRLSVQ